MNGLALPVEFEEEKAARNFAQAGWGHGRANNLGLSLVRRGKTVFVYKK